MYFWIFLLAGLVLPSMGQAPVQYTSIEQCHVKINTYGGLSVVLLTGPSRGRIYARSIYFYKRDIVPIAEEWCMHKITSIHDVQYTKKAKCVCTYFKTSNDNYILIYWSIDIANTKYELVDVWSMLMLSLSTATGLYIIKKLFSH